LSPNPSGTAKRERTFAQVLLKKRMLDGPVRSSTVSKRKRLEWLDDLERCRDALRTVRAAKKLAAKHPHVLGDLNRDLNKAESFLAEVVKSSPNAKKAVANQKAGRRHRQSSLEMVYNRVRRGKGYSGILKRIWKWIELLDDFWPNDSFGR
jgi:hypothetical protein